MSEEAIGELGVCLPVSAKNTYVNKEIKRFAQKKGLRVTVFSDETVKLDT